MTDPHAGAQRLRGQWLAAGLRRQAGPPSDEPFLTSAALEAAAWIDAALQPPPAPARLRCPFDAGESVDSYASLAAVPEWWACSCGAEHGKSENEGQSAWLPPDDAPPIEKKPTPPQTPPGPEADEPRPAPARDEALRKLLGRYLDNHCVNADAEGMSALCECQLCRDTRDALTRYAASQPAPQEQEVTPGAEPGRRAPAPHLDWCAIGRGLSCNCGTDNPTKSARYQTPGTEPGETTS